MTMAIEPEPRRGARLLDAPAKAETLFAEVEARGLIAPGRRETELSAGIRDLAGELFGVCRFWHKLIVRCGVNTLLPYR